MKNKIRLETKLGLYFIICMILILGSIAILLWPMNDPYGITVTVTVKIVALALFAIGTKIFQRHFQNNY
jgi:predicted membrane channel-forming protein YqfA (hemolysin III family)